jgi:hypothetical protein
VKPGKGLSIDPDSFASWQLLFIDHQNNNNLPRRLHILNTEPSHPHQTHSLLLNFTQTFDPSVIKASFLTMDYRKALLSTYKTQATEDARRAIAKMEARQEEIRR